jgi:hypothetical protein
MPLISTDQPLHTAAYEKEAPPSSRPLNPKPKNRNLKPENPNPETRTPKPGTSQHEKALTIYAHRLGDIQMAQVRR